ncbi:MAG: hypothetical protein O7G83_08895 [Proteobacteria bacterium]|nr:hypothetical protein [Pseudomonadota bacterium]
MAGTDASMAPGFETMETLEQAKSDPNYWARPDVKAKPEAAEYPQVESGSVETRPERTDKRSHANKPQ